MINNATEREKNQFGDKFVEKLIRRIALNHFLKEINDQLVTVPKIKEILIQF